MKSQFLRLSLSLSLIAAIAVPGHAASPQPVVRVQGATTFHAEILVPYRAAIEKSSGRLLDVVANKSSWGLLALLEGRADLAMISAPLDAEIAAARLIKPDSPYEALQEFKVRSTRIAFAVHTQNPVTKLSFESVAKLLKGEIANWKDLGGPDVPVLVVAVKEGGGTVVAVRSQMLGDAPLAPNAVRIESAKHVLKVVSQEPGAIGIAQLSLIREARLHEVVTERHVEQPLSFVTSGPPSPGAMAIIEAARLVAADERD